MKIFLLFMSDVSIGLGMTNTRKSYYLSIAFLGAIFGSHAQAQSLLLMINDSNPAAVTITATTGAALASSSNQRFDIGFDLTNFYPNSVFQDVTDSGSSLTTFIDGTPFYNDTQSDDLSTSGSFVDLSIYSNGQVSDQDFVAGTQAFTGTLTLNLSEDNLGNPVALPANGTVGQIFVGSTGLFQPTPTLIGTYVVSNTATPEPSQVALLLAGGLALLVFCSRLRRGEMVA
jgi:hypothetical protein